MRSPAQAEMGGYQLADRHGHLPRPLPRELRPRPRQSTPNKPLPYRFALPTDESRLPARPSHHGAGAVELVPALRPQPPDLRPEYFLGQARGLHESHAAGVSRTRRCQQHRIARDKRKLIRRVPRARRPVPWNLRSNGTDSILLICAAIFPRRPHPFTSRAKSQTAAILWSPQSSSFSAVVASVALAQKVFRGDSPLRDRSSACLRNRIRAAMPGGTASDDRDDQCHPSTAAGLS